MQQLYDSGYSSTDIIQTLFRVVRNTDMPEFLKLEYIKVQLLPVYEYVFSSRKRKPPSSKPCSTVGKRTIENCPWLHHCDGPM